MHPHCSGGAGYAAVPRSRASAHMVPAPPMKVSVFLRLQKKSWVLTILSLQDFTASSTPHMGAKDRNSELREGAAGESPCRNWGSKWKNLQFLRFKFQPSCVYYTSKCSAKSGEMKVIRCSFKPHKGSVSKDPGGNWFDKHPFSVLAKERIPSKHPGTTRLPYRASGSCPAEQGQKLLLPRRVRAYQATAGTMSDLCSLDCKTSPPGSLRSSNQQRNRQQTSNMENLFRNPAAKTQTKPLLNPGHRRTDQNQPPMRPQRANAKEIHLGVSTHISANPPVHLFTHPSCVGLPRSSPLSLTGSSTGLKATDRTAKFVLGLIS